LVIIPHFNDSERLLRALQSINHYLISNDYKVIVIDDCSKVFHLDTIKKYIYDYEIVLIENDVNNGPAYCRNVGLNWAIDNYFSHVMFVDSDDHLCDFLEISEYLLHEITIFNHYESREGYSYYFDYNNHIIKVIDNFKGFISVSDSIKRYALQPNKVPMLGTCWAKIFAINSIIEKKYFNVKMRTFEDVEFLISLLSSVERVKIVNKSIYVHTNSAPGLSATFGGTQDFNKMFSFLIVSRALSRYFKLKLPGEFFNIRHFNACYYSISLIRIALRVKNLSQFLNLYSFIRKRMQSMVFYKAFSDYNVDVAEGRKAIKLLILYRFSFVLAILIILISRKRYKNA
jgi:hypothetical protein